MSLFLYMMLENVLLYFFTCNCPVFSATLMKGLFFIVYSCLLCHRLIDHEFISGPCILFLWSICLSLCPFCNALMTVALYYSLKSGSMIPLVSFFFLKIVLVIEGPLSFHTKFEIICSSSVKNPIVIWQGLHWLCRLP